MKYIIFEDNSGLEHPLIFSEIQNHSDIAQAFPYFKVIGAGFCYITSEGKISNYGKSVSLNIDATAKDFNILNRMVA